MPPTRLGSPLRSGRAALVLTVGLAAVLFLGAIAVMAVIAGW